MLRKKHSLHLLVLLVVIFSSCTSEPTSEEGTASEEHTVHEETPKNLTEEPENNVETVWGVYQGTLGVYDQHVVMQLSITGNEVQGSYFYSKHQKSLNLKGAYDAESGLMQVTESYKGKTTGYLEFTLSRGEIVGKWMKKEGAEDKEDFSARLIGVDKNEYEPVHEHYLNKHEISIYNVEEGDVEEVVDVLKINKIGGGYFSFYYSVIGTNAHLGNIEGFGEIGDDEIGIFRDDEACELEFTFSKNTVEVHETGDCQLYRGYRAYFGGILTKAK